MNAPQFPNSELEVRRRLSATKQRRRRLLYIFATATFVIYGFMFTGGLNSKYWVAMMLLYVFGLGPYFTVRWHQCMGQLHDLKPDSENRALLNESFTEGRPYALFLRQFESERIATDYIFPSMYSPHTGGKILWERRLLRSLGQLLPVFAFTYSYNCGAESCARRVTFTDSDWKEALNVYGDGAHLILIYLEKNRASSGISHEIAWLESHQHWGKTALVIKELDQSAQGAFTDSSVENARWVISAKSLREGALPHDMAAIVQGINEGQIGAGAQMANDTSGQKRSGTRC